MKFKFLLVVLALLFLGAHGTGRFPPSAYSASLITTGDVLNMINNGTTDQQGTLFNGTSITAGDFAGALNGTISGLGFLTLFNVSAFSSIPQDAFELFFLPEPQFAEEPMANRARHPHRTAEVESARNSKTLPDSVDWKALGAVNDPEFPGILCRGGSHAYAVTSVLESAHFIKTGKLLNLSRQELISCTHFIVEQEDPLGGTLTHEGMANCLWGSIEEDYKFIEENGLRTVNEYAYDLWQQNSQCYLNNNNWTSIAVDGYTVLEDADEEDIKALVAEHPVTAKIYANCLKNYTRGTFTPPQNCTSGTPNHYVTIVGYGTDGYGDYWLIRNSWGTIWGKQGYFQLKRNAGSLGINKHISWPNNVVVLTEQMQVERAKSAQLPKAPPAPAPPKSSAASFSAALLLPLIALFVLF